MAQNRAAGTRQGVIVRWDDSKGFGFVRSGEQDYFFHISAARGFTGRPQQGQAVTFVPQQQGKRWRATEVRAQAGAAQSVAASRPAARPAPGVTTASPATQQASAQHTQPPRQTPQDMAQQVAQQAKYTLQTTPAYILAVAAFGALLGILVLLGRLSLWVAVGYAVMSFITYGVFAQDKAAARAGQWRTAEKTLLWWSVLGGWPGALLAMYQHNHKRAKSSFMWRFWGALALNIAALFGLMGVR